MAKGVQAESFRKLQEQVRKFVAEREWDRFHSPKNLSMAISVECAELMEHFQWLSEDQSRALGKKERTAIAHELADIQIYLISLARALEVDLVSAAAKKLVINREKYPIEKARGNSRKYTEFT